MNIEKESFLLCFCAVIWRKVWNDVVIYCNTKSIDITSDIILKCFKCNLLAPCRIVEIVKPFLIRALKNGFLMPQEFKQNKDVELAIRLFGEAYKICQIQNEQVKKNAQFYFIIDQTLNNKIQNIIDENFAEMIDIWDIEMGLIVSEDPYFNLIQYHLLSFLQKN